MLEKFIDKNLSCFIWAHLSVCKQILGINKTVKNMKVRAEVGRVPFKINIETQKFMFLQRFPFLNEDTCLYKAFYEETHLEHTNK